MASAPSLLRQARPLITYAGKDVSVDWVSHLLHLTWKRSIGMENKADTISLSLADPSGYFRQTYDIRTKQPLRLQLESWNWNFIGEHLLSDATEMEIIRVEIDGKKDGGSLVTITASSIPVSGDFRLTKKSRPVENSDLKTVAAAIAKDNGWTLSYTASDNPKIGHADQHDQSDATFLNRFCREHDLTLKVKNKTLIIASVQDLEKQAPKGTIVCPKAGTPGGINSRGIISFRLCEDAEDTYANALVTSVDNKTGKTTDGLASDADAKGPTHTEVKKPVGPVVDRQPEAVIEPEE